MCLWFSRCMSWLCNTTAQAELACPTIASDGEIDALARSARCQGQPGLVFPDLLVRDYHTGMDLEPESRRGMMYARGVLTSVYIELSMPELCDEVAELTLTAARVLTPAILRGLEEDVANPWPWALFLRRLLALPETEEVSDAFQRVYEMAEQILDEKGLELIRPEDVIYRGILGYDAAEHLAVLVRQFHTTRAVARRTRRTTPRMRALR